MLTPHRLIAKPGASLSYGALRKSRLARPWQHEVQVLHQFVDRQLPNSAITVIAGSALR